MPNLLQPAKADKYTFIILVLLSIALTGKAQEIDLKNDLILVDSIVKQQIPASTK
jgi:hypothetical protein